jgi:ribosomal protein L37AE/L43A
MPMNQHAHMVSDRGPTCPGCQAAVTLKLRTSDTHLWCFCLRCGRTFDGGLAARPAAAPDYSARLAAGLAPERRRQQQAFAGPDRRRAEAASAA